MNEDMKKVAKFLAAKIESAKEEIIEYIDEKFEEIGNIEEESEEGSDELEGLDETETLEDNGLDELEEKSKYKGKRQISPTPLLVQPKNEEKPKKSLFGNRKDAVIF